MDNAIEPMPIDNLFCTEWGRVLINRQPSADLDVPPNVRYWE